jgi:hypothetical protein
MRLCGWRQENIVALYVNVKPVGPVTNRRQGLFRAKAQFVPGANWIQVVIDVTVQVE